MSEVTRFGPQPLLANEIANKAYVDAGSGGTGQTFARVVKKIDETINSSTVLQDDDELFVALNANKIYTWLLLFYVNSGATPDFKYAFSIPAGATGLRMDVSQFFVVDDENTSAITTTVNFGTATPVKSSSNWGRVIMGGTAGNLQMQWAQLNSNAGDTTVEAGSLLVVWEETA